jgi:hypothetical protein
MNRPLLASRPDFFAILAAVGNRAQQQFLALIAVGFLGLTLPCVVTAQSDPETSDPQLVDLAGEFYSWLSVNQPASPFAAIRTARPLGWEPDWSQTALQQRKIEYIQFQSRLKALNTSGYETGDLVDLALLGAAMERVHWQFEVLASPRRDPGFFLDQSLGSLYELLIESPQPDQAAMEELVRRLLRFPSLINTAKLMLDRTVPTLSDSAIARIGDEDTKISELEESLRPFVPRELESDFALGLRAAGQSLKSYKDWLIVSQPRFTESHAVGEQRLRWYLGHVAMIPRSPDSILVETELALARVGAELALGRQRHAQSLEVARLESVDRLVQISEISQGEIANYLMTAGLVTVGEGTPEFQLAPLPATLVPIANMGDPLDFAADVGNPGWRYLSSDKDEGKFLENAAWTEPRLLFTWDGTPGRHSQFWSASTHSRQLRHRATGATLSNGLALYFHEQLTQAGLYSFKPASHQLALQFLALKAALAQADIRLARDEWNVEVAVEFLVVTAGLPTNAALSSVQELVAYPGAAGAEFAAYGQAVRYLSDASRKLGDDFSLPVFNDRLLQNAHVPVALQRWEFLGQDDEFEQLVEQRGRPATVPQ